MTSWEFELRMFRTFRAETSHLLASLREDAFADPTILNLEKNLLSKGRIDPSLAWQFYKGDFLRLVHAALVTLLKQYLTDRAAKACSMTEGYGDPVLPEKDISRNTSALHLAAPHSHVLVQLLAGHSFVPRSAPMLKLAEVCGDSFPDSATRDPIDWQNTHPSLTRRLLTVSAFQHKMLTKMGVMGCIKLKEALASPPTMNILTILARIYSSENERHPTTFLDREQPHINFVLVRHNPDSACRNQLEVILHSDPRGLQLAMDLNQHSEALPRFSCASEYMPAHARQRLSSVYAAHQLAKVAVIFLDKGQFYLMDAFPALSEALARYTLNQDSTFPFNNGKSLHADILGHSAACESSLKGVTPRIYPPSITEAKSPYSIREVDSLWVPVQYLIDQDKQEESGFQNRVVQCKTLEDIRLLASARGCRLFVLSAGEGYQSRQLHLHAVADGRKFITQLESGNNTNSTKYCLMTPGAKSHFIMLKPCSVQTAIDDDSMQITRDFESYTQRVGACIRSHLSLIDCFHQATVILGIRTVEQTFDIPPLMFGYPAQKMTIMGGTVPSLWHKRFAELPASPKIHELTRANGLGHLNHVLDVHLSFLRLVRTVVEGILPTLKEQLGLFLASTAQLYQQRGSNFQHDPRLRYNLLRVQHGTRKSKHSELPPQLLAIRRNAIGAQLERQLATLCHRTAPCLLEVGAGAQRELVRVFSKDMYPIKHYVKFAPALDSSPEFVKSFNLMRSASVTAYFDEESNLDFLWSQSKLKATQFLPMLPWYDKRQNNFYLVRNTDLNKWELFFKNTEKISELRESIEHLRLAIDNGVIDEETRLLFARHAAAGDGDVGADSEAAHGEDGDLQAGDSGDSSQGMEREELVAAYDDLTAQMRYLTGRNQTLLRELDTYHLVRQYWYNERTNTFVKQFHHVSEKRVKIAALEVRRAELEDEIQTEIRQLPRTSGADLHLIRWVDAHPNMYKFIRPPPSVREGPKKVFHPLKWFFAKWVSAATKPRRLAFSRRLALLRDQKSRVDAMIEASRAHLQELEDESQQSPMDIVGFKLEHNASSHRWEWTSPQNHQLYCMADEDLDGTRFLPDICSKWKIQLTPPADLSAPTERFPNVWYDPIQNALCCLDYHRRPWKSSYITKDGHRDGPRADWNLVVRDKSYSSPFLEVDPQTKAGMLKGLAEQVTGLPSKIFKATLYPHADATTIGEHGGFARCPFKSSICYVHTVILKILPPPESESDSGSESESDSSDSSEEPPPELEGQPLPLLIKEMSFLERDYDSMCFFNFYNGICKNPLGLDYGLSGHPEWQDPFTAFRQSCILAADTASPLLVIYRKGVPPNAALPGISPPVSDEYFLARPNWEFVQNIERYWGSNFDEVYSLRPGLFTTVVKNPDKATHRCKLVTRLDLRYVYNFRAQMMWDWVMDTRNWYWDEAEGRFVVFTYSPHLVWVVDEETSRPCLVQELCVYRVDNLFSVSVEAFQEAMIAHNNYIMARKTVEKTWEALENKTIGDRTVPGTGEILYRPLIPEKTTKRLYDAIQAPEIPLWSLHRDDAPPFPKPVELTKDFAVYPADIQDIVAQAKRELVVLARSSNMLMRYYADVTARFIQIADTSHRAEGPRQRAAAETAELRAAAARQRAEAEAAERGGAADSEAAEQQAVEEPPPVQWLTPKLVNDIMADRQLVNRALFLRLFRTKFGEPYHKFLSDPEFRARVYSVVPEFPGPSCKSDLESGETKTQRIEELIMAMRGPVEPDFRTEFEKHHPPLGTNEPRQWMFEYEGGAEAQDTLSWFLTTSSVAGSYDPH